MNRSLGTFKSYKRRKGHSKRLVASYNYTAYYCNFIAYTYHNAVIHTFVMPFHDSISDKSNLLEKDSIYSYYMKKNTKQWGNIIATVYYIPVSRSFSSLSFLISKTPNGFNLTIGISAAPGNNAFLSSSQLGRVTPAELNITILGKRTSEVESLTASASAGNPTKSIPFFGTRAIPKIFFIFSKKDAPGAFEKPVAHQMAASQPFAAVYNVRKNNHYILYKNQTHSDENAYLLECHIRILSCT